MCRVGLTWQMKSLPSLRTWLHHHVLTESQRALDKALAHETLVSERLRSTVLVGFFAQAGLIVLILYKLFPRIPSEIFHGQLPFATMGLVVGAAFIYELLVRAVIGFFIAHDDTSHLVPLFVRYLNALIETSFPTISLIITARIFDPALALLSPPSLLYFFFILLATLRLDFWMCLFTGAVAAAEYMALAWFYLGQSTSIIPDATFSGLPIHVENSSLFLTAGLVAGLVSLQIRRQLANSFRLVEERNRVLGIFGQYVSPAVVERLLTHEMQLDGEVRYVCLMFLDIRDFTSFSEQRRPEEVVHYLNSLFGFMIESVNQHNGIINKFLGDGFMAVFGAPVSNGEDSRHAVEAALDILAKVAELNAAARIPATRIGIGLHAGEAVIGNVGSAHRKEYTIIGDVVNLASRIEQLNKQFGSQLLVSETVWQLIQDMQQDATPLGPVSVKGHQAPVQVYQLA